MVRVETFNIKKTDKQFNMLMDWCRASKALYNNLVWIYRKVEEKDPDIIKLYDDGKCLKKLISKDSGKEYYSINAKFLRTRISQDSKIIDLQNTTRFECVNFDKVNKLYSKFLDLLFDQVDQAYKKVIAKRKSKAQAKLHFIDKSQKGNVLSAPLRHVNIFKVNTKGNNIGKHPVTSGLSTKDNKIWLSYRKGIFIEGFTLKQDLNSYRSVSICPRNAYIKIVASYETEDPKPVGDLDDNLYLGIDLGKKNFATIVSSDGKICELIDGGYIKGVAYYYQREAARLHSIYDTTSKIKTSNRLQRLEMNRENATLTFIHQASSHIVKLMEQNKIKHCVVGLNEDWKKGGAKKAKENRQAKKQGLVAPNKNVLNKKERKIFNSLPHSRFLEKLKYKLEAKGMTFTKTEESYTSCCSFILNEELLTIKYGSKQERKATRSKYKAKRVRRGLLTCNNPRFKMNCDVNGALNIIRKVNKDFKYDPNKISKNIFTPTRVKVGR